LDQLISLNKYNETACDDIESQIVSNFF